LGPAQIQLILAALREDSEPHARKVGRYELEEEIASGASGTVWRAFDPQIHRCVALKLLRGSSSREERRLRREAQIAGRLKHPNIVAVHDVGSADGQMYVAMDFIQGRSLRGLRLHPQRCAEIIRDAACAVHFAHTKGVIHRDLKPDNLLLDSSGRVYVTDFGLAKDCGMDSSLSLPGSAMGTPSYMSPEQAGGRAGAADARTDVWGLGATLYELATGRPPFDGKAICEVMVSILTEDPPPPRTVVPTLPPELETIILACLEKDRGRRYHSARSLAEDLQCLLEGNPISVRPVPRFRRLIVALRLRRKLLVAAFGTSLLAGSVFLAGTWLSPSRSEAPLADPRAQRRTEWLLERERVLRPYLSRWEEAMAQAERARRATPPVHSDWHGHIQEAIRACDEALGRDPSWEPALLARGRARRLAGDRDGAIQDFSEAIRWDPEHTFARYERGKTYVEQLVLELMAAEVGDPTAPARAEACGRLAESSLEEGRKNLWKLERTEGEILELLIAFARLPVTATDERILAEACALAVRRPSDGRPLWIAGLLHFRSRRGKDAHAAWSRAWEAGPTSAALRFFSGMARGVEGDWEGQLDDCTAAAALEPGLALAHFGRAHALSRLGRWEETLQEASRAATIQPLLLPALNLRALALGTLGNWAVAAEEFERILRMCPFYRLAQHHLALARGMSGQWSLALTELDRLLTLDPEDSNLYLHRGLAKGQLGDWAGAKQDFDRAIELSPDLCAAYANRGTARRHLGDFHGSLADFDAALHRGFRSSSVYLERGGTFLKLGEWDRALRDFDEAARSGLEGAILHYHLGYAKMRKAERKAGAERKTLFRDALRDFEWFLELRRSEGNVAEVERWIESCRRRLAEP